MRIKFIGHEYHQKTASANFFAEILKKLGTVDMEWDGSCDGGRHADLSNARDYDMVVVWQVEIPALQAAEMGLKNFIFVPMYDGAKHLGPRDWRKLNTAKIVNFSSYLHEHVQRQGVEATAYFQYFLDPQKFTPISDFSSLRPFFWQRIMTLGWEESLKLLGKNPVEAFRLHYALDPSEIQKYDLDILNEKDRLPGLQLMKRYNIKISRWFENRAERMGLFEKSNLLFAPRLDEGIGTVTLEALAMGMPVAAHDAPTMNEYIVDGFNGFLYDHRKPSPLPLKDLKKLRQMGKNARHGAEMGHERWMMDQPRLLEFCLTPRETLSRSQISYILPQPVMEAPAVPAEMVGVMKKERGEKSPKDPFLTVAIVTYNGKNELLYSLPGIFSQDFEKTRLEQGGSGGGRDFEIVVIDGGSKDGTVDILRGLGDRIDYWASEKDKGIFDAMNKAVKAARGKYIIFANAGDSLCDPGSLKRLFENMPADTDLVTGHHIFKSDVGIEEIHHVREFDNVWKELKNGKMAPDWMGGIPCHQAMATRTELLRQYPFNVEIYPIAADHEFYYRMKARGAKFHVSPTIVCCYHGGGNSAIKELGCLEEWRKMCRRFTRRVGKVDAFYAPMIKSCIFKNLDKKSLEDLWKIFPRHPFTIAQALLKKFTRLIGNPHGNTIRLDFRRCHQPDFGARVSGFTYAESSWGTWTDGKTATVIFPRNLSGRVLVHLSCPFIYKPTLLNGFSVTLGGVSPTRSSRLKLSTLDKDSKATAAIRKTPKAPGPWRGHKKVHISFIFDLEAPADRLVFTFNNPRSPHELGKSSQDTRKLGFGIQTLGARALKRKKARVSESPGAVLPQAGA